jgi:hypothetical protein
VNLLSLEHDISPVILQRGQAYVDDGLVGRPESTRSGAYVAAVQGSHLYQATVHLGQDGTVLSFACTCPYDGGPVCKHVAAVLLVLRDDGGTECGDGAQGTRVPTIQDLVDNQPRGVLVNLLLSLAERSPLVAQHIRMALGPRNAADTLTECRRLIQEAISLYTDGYGFFEYDAVAGVVTGVRAVSDLASGAADTAPALAVDIHLLIVEEMVRLLQAADDSDGFIGGLIEDSLSHMGEVANRPGLAADTRSVLFQRLLAFAETPLLADWPDWELAVLSVASELVTSSAMRAKWESRLVPAPASQPTEWVHSYRAEQLDVLRHAMIARLDGDAEAERFLMDRLHYPTFREQAIRNALGHARYEEAIILADQGISRDTAGGLPGLVTRWLQLKYEAARLGGQGDVLRHTARDLFMNGQVDYYSELKATYPPTAWEPVWRGLLEELDRPGAWPGAAYLHIITTEHDTPRILQYCRRNPRALEQFVDDLLPTHHDEVAEIWMHHLEQQGQTANGRAAYQALARGINRMRRTGLHDEADRITRSLLEQYPRKRALREELLGDGHRHDQ